MNELFEFDVGEGNDSQDITQFTTSNENSSLHPQSPRVSSPFETDPNVSHVQTSHSNIQSPILSPNSSAPISGQQAPFKKSKWTPEEDRLLIDSVKAHGMGNWSLVSQAVPGRTGKQCRERWINQLCPQLNKDNWTPQEDQILIQQQRIHGNYWSKIAQFLPGRSSNNVKNRWSWLSRHRVSPSLAVQMMPFIVQHQQQMKYQQPFQQMQQIQMQQMQQMNLSSPILSPNSMNFSQPIQPPPYQFNPMYPNMPLQQQTAPPDIPITDFSSLSMNSSMNLGLRPTQSQEADQIADMKNRMAFSDPFEGVNFPATGVSSFTSIPTYLDLSNTQEKKTALSPQLDSVLPFEEPRNDFQFEFQAQPNQDPFGDMNFPDKDDMFSNFGWDH